MIKKKLTAANMSDSVKQKLAEYHLKIDEKHHSIETTNPIRLMRTGQLQMNAVGRFGPATPSGTK
jgi:hypothetical protein